MKNFSIIILIVVVSVLYLINERGLRIPLLSNYKGAFYFLLIIGVMLCANSPLKQMFAGVWYKPFYLIGTLLGILILVLLVGVILKFNMNVRIPYINNYRQAYIFLALLTLSKSILTLIHRLLFKG